ncbi:hypothetical protein ACHAPJ_013454 [Fusarium lateritium]
MSQVLTTTRVKGDGTIVTLGNNGHVRVTDFMDALKDTYGTKCQIAVPGRNVVLALINTQTDTEDACDVVQEFAQSGSISWMIVVDYSLPEPRGVTEPGTVLYDWPWPGPAIPGIVMRVCVNRDGRINVITDLYKQELGVGDKLVGWPGVKFTVGSLTPYRNMYKLGNTATGEKMTTDMLISIKGLTCRPGSWIRERKLLHGSMQERDRAQVDEDSQEREPDHGSRRARH